MEVLFMARQKFSKFIRPETSVGGPITDRDLDIVGAILRYRISPASQLVRLVGGNEDVTRRRLRRLVGKGPHQPLGLPRNPHPQRVSLLPRQPGAPLHIGCAPWSS